MDTATKSRLEAILSAHEQEIAREQDRIDEAHMADVLFAQQFAALKMNVVLPAFTDLENELRRHGHACKVVETDEVYPGDGDCSNGRDGGGSVSGSVRCEFYPNGWARDEREALAEAACLTVSCDKSTGSVKLSESTFGALDRGWSGELGTFGLQDITRDGIAEAFVALVEKVLLDKSFIAKSIKDLHPSWTRPGYRSTSRGQIGHDRRAA
jgi:hypothetical protein